MNPTGGLGGGGRRREEEREGEEAGRAPVQEEREGERGRGGVGGREGGRRDGQGLCGKRGSELRRGVERVRSERGREERNEVVMYIAGNSHWRTFHLRSHQLSNWESDGGCEAPSVSTRPERGAPLRPHQNTITSTARPDARSYTHTRAHS